MEDGSATPAPAARQLYCPVGGLSHARCRGGGTTGSLSFLSSAFPPFPGPQHGPDRLCTRVWPG